MATNNNDQTPIPTIVVQSSIPTTHLRPIIHVPPFFQAPPQQPILFPVVPTPWVWGMQTVHYTQHPNHLIIVNHHLPLTRVLVNPYQQFQAVPAHVNLSHPPTQPLPNNQHTWTQQSQTRSQPQPPIQWTDSEPLMELGFSAPDFTWANGRYGSDSIRERLDRALATPSWVEIYSPTQLDSKIICWKAPASGYLKLNTDVLWNDEHSIAGGGGVFRDGNGKWLLGFTCRAGTARVCRIRAVREGLQIAKQRGFKHIELEVDALHLQNLLRDPILRSNPRLRALVDDIILSADLLEGVIFTHTCREANSVAHALAGVGSKQSADFKIYEDMPNFIRKYVEEDMLNCKA